MPTLLFLHLLGVAWWLGGGFAAMTMSLAAKGEARPALATVTRLQWAIARFMIFPGSLLTVITGLGLTLRLGSDAMKSGSLVAMQAIGILGALLALTFVVPTAAKLARLDPVGEHAAYFDRLRAKQRVAGSVAGVLGLLALLAGAFYRYGG
jgi:hypothetical protein